MFIPFSSRRLTKVLTATIIGVGALLAFWLILTWLLVENGGKGRGVEIELPVRNAQRFPQGLAVVYDVSGSMDDGWNESLARQAEGVINDTVEAILCRRELPDDWHPPLSSSVLQKALAEDVRVIFIKVGLPENHAPFFSPLTEPLAFTPGSSKGGCLISDQLRFHRSQIGASHSYIELGRAVAYSALEQYQDIDKTRAILIVVFSDFREGPTESENPQWRALINQYLPKEKVLVSASWKNTRLSLRLYTIQMSPTTRPLGETR